MRVTAWLLVLAGSLALAAAVLALAPRLERMAAWGDGQRWAWERALEAPAWREPPDEWAVCGGWSWITCWDGRTACHQPC